MNLAVETTIKQTGVVKENTERFERVIPIRIDMKI